MINLRNQDNNESNISFLPFIILGLLLFLMVPIYFLGYNYGKSSIHNPLIYNANTSVETSNYTKDYYGTYDWENGISTDWLYSGNVGISNIDNHDSVVFLEGGGSHPTLVLTISNFEDYQSPNDTQIHTISMWLYPNNTQDVSVTISPQLFLMFNSTDSHLWYLDFLIEVGGAWVDTNFTYLNNTWLYLEWSFNNIGFNITTSYPPTKSTIPIVINAPLNPYYPLPQPNYLDYILFTTAPTETDGFYIDTINFDWILTYSYIPSSNIPSEASWLSIIYFWRSNFTFQFDNITSNYRNVYNLTIYYNETTQSNTPIRLSFLQQWQFPINTIPNELGLNIPSNYLGNIGINNQLYSLYMSKNGSVNLIITHGTTENVPNTIVTSMNGYFWKHS